MMELTHFDSLLHRFAHRSQAIERDASLIELMQALQGEQLDVLPLPGQGCTLERWRALARVAGCDLSLAKLYEGHTDALAILAECGAAQQVGNSIWGVWAAEPPDARAYIVERDGERVRLQGRKAWCSGALQIDRALLTAWEDDQPQLVAIELPHPSQRILAEHWQAVGMAATSSVVIELDDSPGLAIGSPGQYLSRPGFWQGGAGIAACWYGAPRPWPATFTNSAANPGATRMPMRIWAQSMQPCTVPVPPFANAPPGSTSTLRTTPASRCGAPAPRSIRQSSRSFSIPAGRSVPRRSVAAAISPGSVPTCRYTYARAMPNATWPSWADN